MITLRADENRFLLQAEPADAPAVRRIPGARWSQPHRCWQLPRQPASVLVLDRVFGRDGWEAESNAVIDVADARQRPVEAARGRAQVHLKGSQLGVVCAVPDKELVKRVPGYSWSPAQRMWFVAALPLALDILQEAFGANLEVDEDARSYIELRRLAEAQAPSPGAAAFPLREAAPAGHHEPVTGEPAPGLAVPVQSDLAEAGGDGVERLERGLARVETLLERLLAAIEQGRAFAPAAATPASVEPEPPAAATADWREIVELANTDPAAALDGAHRMLQTSGPDDRALRAAAGIAAFRARDLARALEHLSGALDGQTDLGDADLTRLAARTFTETVCALATQATCPANGPITSADSFRKALLTELARGGAFDAGSLASQSTAGTLETLVMDHTLQLVDRELSDACRVAHILAIAHGGSPLAAHRVLQLLREQSLHAEAQALALILYANVLLETESASEWLLRWPSGEQEAPMDDGGWLVATSLPALRLLNRDLAGPAALALLAIVAPGPADAVTLADRRALVSLVPPNAPGRHYAEFLASFRLAARGERLNMREFPGYAATLANVALERSWAHLTEVYMAGSGTGSGAAQEAAGAIYPALLGHGISAPEQLVELLDLLALSPTADNALNAVATVTEDQAFKGASMLDRTQRLEIYRAALDAAIKKGHDNDAREAFQRLVRALQDEPGSSQLRALCADVRERASRRLRIPALMVLVETLLEDGAEAAAAMELVRDVIKAGRDDVEDPEGQLIGLQYAYPQLREPIQQAIRESGSEPALIDALPSFPGRSIVVVGGRQSMKKRATPVLEGWGVDVSWLDSAEAKTGNQLPALVAGKADLVVVNTACVSHASSGRAADAARSAGKDPYLQASNGVGTMLLRVREQLEALGRVAEPAPAKPSKVKAIKQRVR